MSSGTRTAAGREGLEAARTAATNLAGTLIIPVQRGVFSDLWMRELERRHDDECHFALKSRLCSIAEPSVAKGSDDVPMGGQADGVLAKSGRRVNSRFGS